MYYSASSLVWAFFVLRNTTSHALLISQRLIQNQVCQQSFGRDPPIPILEIGLQHMLGQMGANATKAENDSIAAESGLPPWTDPSRFTLSHQKADLTQCGPNQPCVDGSCCNTEGKCGYTAYNCNSTATTQCISNCDAHAMCGVNSLYGQQKCGLNLCCSYFGYCGTTDAHCTTTSTTPCQMGFGDCGGVEPPSCPEEEASASKGRKVAYYQGNARYRACDKVYPSQIDTTGLTHLNYAFASIDPTSFNVVPGDPSDVLLYHQFASLKSARMQTWISIGGFDFSDPGPTHTTWSDLCSSPANRATFISSLVDFMNKWGFQGVDFDWEYPAQPDRGGNQEDTANLALLLKEMRATFGTKFGISLALPTVFTYLNAFNPIALQPYVTFFNFMAYDLHGPWEARYLGAKLRPQAAIADIDEVLLPLWFDNIDPGKINLGLPYYGRGYTVSNKSCMDVGCPWSGLSNAGQCTGSPGVLSMEEIQGTIAERRLVPKTIGNTYQKQITFDDQWMAYDDWETVDWKTKYADQHCLGGTMIWSIDLTYSNGSPGPQAMKVSTDGSCGTGISCFSSTYGDCCSARGRCGWKAGYCSSKQGCQDAFGVCDDDNSPVNAPSSPPASPATPLAVGVSLDGSCGANGRSCKGSVWGDCCSTYGYCGSTSEYCSKDKGCQDVFGVCAGGISSSPRPLIGTSDASCGGGKTCKGSPWGNCCSAHGWCGSTADYCSPSNGCQTSFGLCGDDLKVSVDGSCGLETVCQGSPFGNCCSSYGWCGSTPDYCGNGCQSAFGSCA